MAEKTCSVPGCDGVTKTRGWCQAHYMRWLTTGDIQADVPVVRKPKGRICSVDGCNRKHRSSGFCSTHYVRVAKYGDPGPAGIEPRRPGATCSVDGCDLPLAGLGYCDKHYQRVKKHGSTDLPHEFGRRWAGDDITYAGVHSRLRKFRGRASDQVCVSCGTTAQHWAYDHTDPHPKIDERGLPFSPDVNRYQPMCQPCHRRMDADRTRTHGCSVDGCSSPHKARGMCNLHYRRSMTEETRRGDRITGTD